MEQTMINEHRSLHLMYLFENCEPLKDESKNIIDPWDAELTKDQQDMVLRRMKHDVWYYLKYVVKIRQIGSKLEMSYIVQDPSVEAFIYLYSKGISAIFLGTRQLFGKTTLLKLLYLYDSICNGETDSVFIGHGKNMVDQNILFPDYVLNRSDRNTLANMNELKNRNYRKSAENKQTRCFIDELMFHDGRGTLMSMVKDMGPCTYFGVSTLGPHNADLVRFTIPFRMLMYQKDIQAFAETFLQFTGYKPSFLIIANDDDIPKDDRRFRSAKILRGILESQDAIRREIEIEPNWEI